MLLLKKNSCLHSDESVLLLGCWTRRLSVTKKSCLSEIPLFIFLGSSFNFLSLSQYLLHHTTPPSTASHKKMTHRKKKRVLHPLLQQEWWRQATTATELCLALVQRIMIWLKPNIGKMELYYALKYWVEINIFQKTPRNPWYTAEALLLIVYTYAQFIICLTKPEIKHPLADYVVYLAVACLKRFHDQKLFGDVYPFDCCLIIRQSDYVRLKQQRR